MVVLYPDDLSKRERYYLLISSIVPRPIAFVTTVSREGRTNLAPFSFFNGVCSSPPLLSLSIGRRRDELKDTYRNILDTNEFAVHVATWPLREAVNRASADYPAHVSEIDACSLATRPADVIAPPLLADAPLAMECTLFDTWEGPEGTASLVFGQVRVFHVQDELLTDQRTVDVAALDPIGRLGGADYCTVRDIFSMVRPPIEG